MPERINKLFLNDKLNAITKQMQQQKTTPLSKIKLVQPLSVTRLNTPLNNQNLLNVRFLFFLFFFKLHTIFMMIKFMHMF